MAITVPDRIHFDPYGESGIIVTRAPDRILFELPHPGFWNVCPLYFISSLIWLAAIIFGTLSIINHQQWDALWGILVLGVFGALPTLFARYLCSRRATLEITPNHLCITQLAWRQLPVRCMLPWDQLASVRIGVLADEETSEGQMGLVFETRDGRETRHLTGRSVGELERLQGLIKSLILPPAVAAHTI